MSHPLCDCDRCENARSCTCTVQYESGKGTFRLTSIHCPIHGDFLDPEFRNQHKPPADEGAPA